LIASSVASGNDIVVELGILDSDASSLLHDDVAQDAKILTWRPISSRYWRELSERGCFGDAAY
jgi:hypothetical protein